MLSFTRDRAAFFGEEKNHIKTKINLHLWKIILIFAVLNDKDMKFKVKAKGTIHIADKEIPVAYEFEIKAIDEYDANQFAYGILKNAGLSWNYKIEENENV